MNWSSETKRRYEREAKTYDKTRAGWVTGLPFTLEVRRISKKLQKGMILEVASATGKFSRTFESRIIQVDLAVNALKIAKSKKRDNEVICADANYLPFRPGSFKNVICSRGIKFFPDLKAVLNEFKRCVAPGGPVIITTDYCRDYILYKPMVRWLYMKTPFENHYSAAELIACSDGLEVREIESFIILPPLLYEHAPRGVWGLLARADLLLSTVFSGWAILVCFRKSLDSAVPHNEVCD